MCLKNDIIYCQFNFKVGWLIDYQKIDGLIDCVHPNKKMESFIQENLDNISSTDLNLFETSLDHATPEAS